jgi:ABC-2 type transport system permease protein
MTWLDVARKDYRDAARSKVLWVLSLLYVLLVVGIAYFLVEVVQLPTDASTGVLLLSMLSGVSLFVPLIAVAVGYKSIVGERDSGTIKLLLSLPHSRADVVLGKLAGRWGVVFTATVVGFAAGGLVVAALLGSFDLGSYLSFLGVTLLYAAAYVAIAIAWSTATGSTTIAAIGGFGTFLFFSTVWGVANNLLVWVVDGYFPMPLVRPPPEWSQAIRQLSPNEAYNMATRALLGGGNAQQAAQQAPAAQDAPFYLQNEIGFLVLLLWVVVPVALAYFRFERSDL